MNEYQLEVCGIRRSLPYIPIDEERAFASFMAMGDIELIEAVAPVLAEKIGKVDMLLTAEAKGISWGYAVGKALGLKEIVIARKSVKTYMRDVISVSVQSITTRGLQTLYLDGNDAAKLKGRRICLLDDVISTGESMIALEKLADQAGAEVVCRAAVLAEGPAKNRTDIVYLEPLPLFKKDENGDYRPIEE